MNLFLLILQILTALAGLLTAGMSIPLYLRLKWPASVLFGLKLFASALSPLFALIGILCLVVGLATGSLFIGMIGLYDLAVFLVHIIGVTRPPSAATGFGQAFGADWENRIKPGLKEHFLPSRTIPRLPEVPNPRLEQDLVFSTVPGTGRQLLCDVWQPPEDVSPSGLAFIYLHGSAWYLLDKDYGTRPLFRYLAAQGHVVMDVAYRLAPETDMMGMVNDVKRAVAWMKEHAADYGIRPDRVVLGGGSAGGHLALLAAFTAGDSQFNPAELEGKELSVRAVISLYGPTDLEAVYYHTSQDLTTRIIPGQPPKSVPTEMPAWMVKSMGDDYHRLGFDKGMENAGALAPLLGGHPDERPEAYTRFSPVAHVHPDCPPTYLIQGEHDLITAIEATRRFYKRLSEEKVPAVLHVLPQADHAFDLIMPRISPSAHTAFYEVERFLGLVA